MKGFALGLALKQRRKATRKSPINFPARTDWVLILKQSLTTYGHGRDTTKPLTTQGQDGHNTLFKGRSATHHVLV